MDKARMLQRELIESACYRMDESVRMITICINRLDEDLLWKKPNTSTNSVGNLILHLCGNITQYGIASLNDLPDDRNRDGEFEASGGLTKTEVLEMLEKTLSEAKNTFETLSVTSLLQKRSVQGFEFSGVGNIIHVTEHLSYHTGQIALWTKLLTNKDLGFYKDVDLNIKNENNSG